MSEWVLKIKIKINKWSRLDELVWIVGRGVCQCLAGEKKVIVNTS